MMTAIQARAHIFKADEIPEYNEYEAFLHQVYSSGDKVYSYLDFVTKPLIKS